MVRYMTAALIFRGGRLLCVHNTKHGALRVEPPGGKKDGEETLEQCVKRELLEETGCEILILDLFGVYDTLSPEGPFEVHMYLASIVSGEPRNQEAGKHGLLAWHTYEELERFGAQGALVPNLQEALPRLREHF